MCSRRGDDSNPSPNATLKSPRLLNEDLFNVFYVSFANVTISALLAETRIHLPCN